MKPQMDIYRCAAFSVRSDGDGAVTKRLTFCTNASQARAAELQLRASSEVLRAFARAITDAHKAPLSAFEPFGMTITNGPEDFTFRNGGFVILIEKSLTLVLADALLDAR